MKILLTFFLLIVESLIVSGVLQGSNVKSDSGRRRMRGGSNGMNLLQPVSNPEFTLCITTDPTEQRFYHCSSPRNPQILGELIESQILERYGNQLAMYKIQAARLPLSLYWKLQLNTMQMPYLTHLFVDTFSYSVFPFISAVNMWVEWKRYYFHLKAFDLYYDRSPVYMTLLQGKNEANALKLLDMNMVDTKSRDAEGKSLLMVAAATEKIQIMRRLLEINHMIIFDYDDYKRTALTHATIYGRVSAVELLLVQGSKVNHMDFIGKTPLHYAAINPHPDTLMALIMRGADVNAQDQYGSSVLMDCILGGHVETALTLLNPKMGTKIHLRDHLLRSELMFAAQGNSIKLIALLISMGAQVNLQDVHGKTALDYAQAQNYSQSQLIARILQLELTKEKVKNLSRQ